jgi:hypothetical protein
MFTLVTGLLLMAAGSSDSAKLPPTWVAAKARLQEEMQSHWAERHHQGRNKLGTEPGPSLSARLAPPMPQVWPPDGKGRYVVHAFAAGIRPGLHDGEEVAAPWADWLIAGNSRTVKDLGDLRRLGMQGVRPMQGDEGEVHRTADAAEQAVVAMTRTSRPKLTPLVKRYYCQWFFNNAVISAELQRLHPEFFQWLECTP